MRAEIVQRIKEITRGGLCTGCGTCMGVCPEKALRVEMTDEGTYIPKIGDNICQECFLCTKVCPVSNENIKELNQFVFDKIPDNRFIGNFISCYGGFSTNSAIRWSATSGGLITSLAIFLLRNQLIDGALLTRIDEANPLKAVPFMARTEKDILSAMGAKYVPVPLNQLLSQVLSEHGRFAVVGLPCHMQGIRRAELNVRDLRARIVYHLGLTCSHTLNNHGVEYILHNMGVSVNKIVRLQYRGGGWPGGIRVLLDEGQQKFLPNQASLWSEIFGAYFFTPFCCTVCHDHLNEFADISFADAWLPEIMKNDKVGTSIAITRTRTGEDLLEAAKSSGEVELFALSKEDITQSQLWPLLFKKRNIKARLRFLKIFGSHVPKNLRENMDAFVNTTLWDYVAAPIPYINILISRNALLENILQHMPLKILRLYRQKFKQWLLHDSEQAIKNEKRAKSTAPIKIVITNSHSNNRGDEAAQRSLIHSLGTLMPDTIFTVLTASPKGLQLPKDVRVLRFFHLSKRSAPFIILWIILRSLGIRLSAFDKLGELFQALEEMATANVVISAPGGPYFGELYTSHEIQHLFHIYLAKILRKPVMIYSPSIGPFESRWRNIIRKHVLNNVEIITVRDHISKEYLDNLNLSRPFSYLAADSAFQDTISLDRDELRNVLVSEQIIDSQNDDVCKKLLVGITPAGASWNYRNAIDPEKEQERYNKIMAKTIDYLVDRFEGTVVFFPQLYGMSDDMPLITEIIRLVSNQGAVKVVSKDLNSEIQQSLISQMDLVIGNRYHSVIFALKGGVPAICLAYEHKSIGVMEAVKLDRFVIKISDLSYETLAAKIDEVLVQKEEIRSLLKSQIHVVRRRSLVNSILAMALINCAVRHSAERKDLKKEIDKLMLQFQEGKLPFTDD